MKHIKTIIIVLILLSSNIYAQISDKIIISSLKEGIIRTDDNKTINFNQHEINKEITPIRFNPADKHKLNQNVIWSPTKVTKNLKVDFDDNNTFDKKVTLTYVKFKNVTLNFTLFADGIIIETKNKNITIDSITSKNGNVINKSINKNGIYTLKLSNGYTTILTVSDFGFIK